ncbi:MAG: CopG family antitoxin [Thermomicrobiales bacterium]
MKRPTVDLGYPTEAHGKIPSFNNIEEGAEFWDTHDITDFLDERAPVEITVGGELAERLTVRLEQADREELARRAAKKGVGPSTLARTWLKEGLQQEQESEKTAKRRVG